MLARTDSGILWIISFLVSRAAIVSPALATRKSGESWLDPPKIGSGALPVLLLVEHGTGQWITSAIL